MNPQTITFALVFLASFCFICIQLPCLNLYWIFELTYYWLTFFTLVCIRTLTLANLRIKVFIYPPFDFVLGHVPGLDLLRICQFWIQALRNFSICSLSPLLFSWKKKILCLSVDPRRMSKKWSRASAFNPRSVERSRSIHYRIKSPSWTCQSSDTWVIISNCMFKLLSFGVVLYKQSQYNVLYASQV